MTFTVDILSHVVTTVMHPYSGPKFGTDREITIYGTDGMITLPTTSDDPKTWARVSVADVRAFVERREAKPRLVAEPLGIMIGRIGTVDRYVQEFANDIIGGSLSRDAEDDRKGLAVAIQEAIEEFFDGTKERDEARFAAHVDRQIDRQIDEAQS